jgi:hypothetical protein
MVIGHDRTGRSGRRWRAVATLVALVALGVATSAVPLEAASLEGLAWLLGRWEREARSGTAVEEWRRLGERVFAGEGAMTSAAGERRVFEELLLVEMGGDVFYVAKVSENAYPVPFRLTALEGRRAVFENPEHDFPKTITYSLLDDGTLLAVTAGDGREIEFRFTVR